MCFYKKLSTATALAATAILVTGCIEQSTVVKVKKDGTGVVHIRMHVQETSIGTFDNGKSHMVDPNVPSRQRIEAVRKSLGKDVRLVTAEPSVNRNGWRGYDVIYAFDDISNVTLSHELISLLAEKEPAASDAAENADGTKDASETDASETKDAQSKKKKKSSPIDINFQFAMNNGVLEIRSDGFAQPAAVANVERAVDPFAKEPSSPTATLNVSDMFGAQIAAQLMADAKLGTFVQIEGELADSNARYRDKSLITLANLKLGEILANPAGTTLLQQAGHKFSRETTQELADRVKGLSIDTRNPITVKWK